MANFERPVKDQGSRIKDQGSNGKRKRFRLEKKSLHRILPAKEAAGRRVSAEVLQHNANEKEPEAMYTESAYRRKEGGRRGGRLCFSIWRVAKSREKKSLR